MPASDSTARSRTVAAAARRSVLLVGIAIAASSPDGPGLRSAVAATAAMDPCRLLSDAALQAMAKLGRAAASRL